MTFNQKLIHSKSNQTLLAEIAQADTLSSRLKGLLGRKNLSSHQGLWIRRCNSIHTFFMQFNIDCLFLNSNMQVVSWKTNIPRRRVILPVWRASSVIETSAGVIQSLVEAKQLQQGDSVHVCP
jgi:uncharacterized membrane protein (UPF0127 family)